MSDYTSPSDFEVLVESNEEVAADFYRLRLYHSAVAERVIPGQFVQLQVGSGGMAPLLRVPLSVSAADLRKGTIEVLFEDMGPKTSLLSRAREGEHLRCLGPLGIGFPDPPATAVMVGGGIGVPPLLFLGERLRARHHVRLLVGAREAAKLLPEELLSAAASEHRIATDDGSAGQRGVATDLLVEELDALSAVTVYTCGPSAMMAAVAGICRARGIACFASLEEYMACGFGVCVGCVVPRVATDSPYHRYSRVCADGPVYDAREIAWEDVHPLP
jgi:dihydroorotate dehydrogenase electron transfer subunit